MARGPAGERLSQLEAAIAQLGARLRRLEESSSARASALEQRLGRLEHSLARARHTPEPHGDHAHTTTSTPRARSLESILIANGISFTKEAFPKTNPSSPENETKQYSGFESRSWEVVRAARRGAALEVQRRLDGAAAPLGRAPALRDLDLPGGGRRSTMHVGVAQLLLLDQPVAAALDENASKPLRLAESTATAHAVAAFL